MMSSSRQDRAQRGSQTAIALGVIRHGRRERHPVLAACGAQDARSQVDDAIGAPSRRGAVPAMPASAIGSGLRELQHRSSRAATRSQRPLRCTTPSVGILERRRLAKPLSNSLLRQARDLRPIRMPAVPLPEQVSLAKEIKAQVVAKARCEIFRVAHVGHVEQRGVGPRAPRRAGPGSPAAGRVPLVQLRADGALPYARAFAIFVSRSRGSQGGTHRMFHSRMSSRPPRRRGRSQLPAGTPR